MARSSQTKNFASGVMILRTLPDEKAFYFYAGIGKPLNLKAKNLEEFLAILRTVDESSVKFHLERGDFEKWIEMLGDHKLVQSISDFKSKKTSQTSRQKLIDLTKARITRLKKIEH
jgi:hypothetical protein